MNIPDQGAKIEESLTLAAGQYVVVRNFTGELRGLIRT